ncbi:hypothetical protein LZ30DRAFT_46995 [Colletotrichum cereale]|nr:hypothetical protein LZ30DRAFT_46995 [Colletotrichum cereale]
MSRETRASRHASFNPLLLAAAGSSPVSWDPGLFPRRTPSGVDMPATAAESAASASELQLLRTRSRRPDEQAGPISSPSHAPAQTPCPSVQLSLFAFKQSAQLDSRRRETERWTHVRTYTHTHTQAHIHVSRYIYIYMEKEKVPSRRSRNNPPCGSTPKGDADHQTTPRLHCMHPFPCSRVETERTVLPSPFALLSTRTT